MAMQGCEWAADHRTPHSVCPEPTRANGLDVPRSTRTVWMCHGQHEWFGFAAVSANGLDYPIRSP
jgi:hypothetical protein